MNVQYLQKTIDTHHDAHQIFKDVAKRITVRAEEDRKKLEEALAADKAHDKKLEEEIEQLKKDLEAKQKEKDEISQTAAGAQLELIEARKKQVLEKEQIKKLGEAAEASSKAVKALEEDITACNVKFKNLLEEKDNISKKLKNQKLSGLECNKGRARDKKKAADAEAELLQKMLGQRKLKEQFSQDVVDARKECAKESQKVSKELLEKSSEISKLASDVEKEAEAVLAANAAAKTLENALNDKTGELADAENKIKRLEGEIQKLREAPAAAAGVPDGKHNIKVCRKLGKLTTCSTVENVEVKDGKITGKSIGKDDGAEKYSVEKGKGGKIVLSQGAFQKLKFNPSIKF